VESLKSLIEARLTYESHLLATVTEIALMVGCETIDTTPPPDITFVGLSDARPALYGKDAEVIAIDLKLAGAGG
jgi:hypothetical protein